jgi:aspartokinase/homoserine dehydrogenase 1
MRPCFERVAAIVESQRRRRVGGRAGQPRPRLAIVLSACKGVTDALLELVSLAEGQQADWQQRLGQLRARHAGIAAALLDEPPPRVPGEFDRDVADLSGVLQTTSIMRSAAQTVRDLCSGYGEIWSTQLFRRYLQRRGVRGGVQWLDARRCVTVEWGPLGPAVQWQESKLRLQALLPARCAATLVITGFIASDPRGVQTTLGRNGSDFSASIFGALLDAAQIHIWTDVDGVLSADPRRVPDAQVIDSLSYNEAMELAYFGAKVIHPQTMAPAVGRDIPIWIRNTFAPDKPGTLICARPSSSLPVKGITSIENVALVNLEGAGMIGVPGTAHRLFGALREEGISVILISQGSSEHSICCAIPQAQAARAKSVLEAAFARELAEGQIQNVDVTPGPGHPGGGRRRHGGHARCRGQGVRRARQCAHQRARDRAGRLGAQHFGGGRRPQRDAGTAGDARELLPVAAYAVDRRHRSGYRRPGAARSARQPARAAGA